LNDRFHVCHTILDFGLGKLCCPTILFAHLWPLPFMPKIPADKYPYLNRLTHHIIDGDYDGIADFNFGLELILDGLEKWLKNNQIASD
jgi:hypothetical protein